MAKKTAPESEPVIEEVKTEEVKTEEVKKPVKKDNYDREMVTVTLFRDNDKYKDDVFVAVNGKGWRIQRGVEVTIPRYVWEVLRKSLKQDNETARLITKLSEQAKF